MNTARFALRQSRQAALVLRGRAAAATPNAACYLSRGLAVAAPAPTMPEPCPTENVNHVRDAISKLLAKDEVEMKPISQEELQMTLNRFASLFEEAQACINDCKEARAGSLEYYEEAFTAQNSVDVAFNAYIDLLDDFRRASDDQIKLLCQDRLALAYSLKCLRQEVHELSQLKQAAA
ncbi:expressed unknown protein [Seminavis robusta]|uniref:Uncharacterized protein n=1 Tax=Seminavis robusta TaxID=568900 RepID=A0A9N8HNC2_9STRA|nr:expressed unknown protein [Seminavis robusta]|eukprot:Sro809_g205600.1 n/a (178) ;mRNA; r:31728-32385